jgi:hypothetical protein
MKRKALIVAGIILLLIISMLATSLTGRKDSQEENQTAEAEIVTLSQLPNGWRLVKHPVYGVSLELPPAWGITVFENGKGKIEGSFLGAGVGAVININREDNVDGLTPEGLLNQNKNNQAAEITQNSVKGVSYVTKLGSEDLPGFINDSYLLVNDYFLGDEILNISCSLSGPNYKLMIPTCEKIVKSLQFIQ